MTAETALRKYYAARNLQYDGTQLTWIQALINARIDIDSQLESIANGDSLAFDSLRMKYESWHRGFSL